MGKDLDNITTKAIKVYMVLCRNSSLPDLALNLESRGDTFPSGPMAVLLISQGELGDIKDREVKCSPEEKAWIGKEGIYKIKANNRWFILQYLSHTRNNIGHSLEVDY